MFKKICTGGVTVGLLFFNVACAQNSTSTNQDLLNLIQQLQAQIQSLQAQVADLQNQVQSVKTELTFSRVLTQGTTGDDVKQLQEFLKTFPDVYPEGLVTGYFGPLTEMAVKKFQEKNGIESVGIVGPKTQAKLNELATTGAGQSGAVPPSPLATPGIQAEVATTTGSLVPASTTVTSSTTTTTSAIATTTTSSPTPSPSSSGWGSGSYAPPPTTTPSPSTTTTATTTATTATSTTADTTPPSTPANLSAAAVSPSQINLSWSSSTDNVGVTGYKIYRGGTQIATITPSAASTTLSYSDTGLQASTAYTYTVAAYDAAGNTSTQSNPASATTQAPPPPPPPQPTAYPTCDQTVKNVPGDYSSIQAAINAANSGDTVKVAAGTYNENLAMKSGICLEGAGVDQTIITKSISGITSGIMVSGVSYVIIKNLTVKNSGSSNADGGGLGIIGSQNVLVNSVRFTDNSATNGGGIIVNGSSNVEVSECLVDNNYNSNCGGGVCVGQSTVTFTNSTIANNRTYTGRWGGGLAYGAGSHVSVLNSIIWGNGGGLGNFGDTGGTGASTNNVSYSDIGGWSGGTNNIDANPQFVSTTDYHLQATSPAIGMGVYPSVETQSSSGKSVQLANILESLRSLMLTLQKLQGLL